MDLNLRGKRALVTGASKGIGRATATVLAEEGCDLVLVARSAEGLAEVAGEIGGRFNVSVQTIAADLSKSAEVDRVAREAGQIDILVNNAGAIPPGGIEDVDEKTWRESWDLKVFGYINMTRAFYGVLKARKGVIVNVIGAGGERYEPGYIVGTPGNASLMAFTKALARGAHRDGMRVVAINPGPVLTGRVEVMLKTRARNLHGDESRWREFFATMPFGRAADPQEIGNAVAFLASPRSAYTNGTILTIDGGME